MKEVSDKITAILYDLGFIYYANRQQWQDTKGNIITNDEIFEFFEHKIISFKKMILEHQNG